MLKEQKDYGMQTKSTEGTIGWVTIPPFVSACTSTINASEP